MLIRNAQQHSAGGVIIPQSVINPVVGTSRLTQWNYQVPGATGPRNNFPNGKWNTTYPEVPGATWPARPVDPYLLGLGFYYDNIGQLWIPFTWIDPGASRTIADYDFAGSPGLSFWGDGSNILFTDCANFSWQVGSNINSNPDPSYRMDVKSQYCDYNATLWALLCNSVLEMGPLNRIHNQVQTLGFAGGDGYVGLKAVNTHNNYITGGGTNPPPSAHVEWWQHRVQPGLMGTGSYMYLEDNMIDFKDGQVTEMSGDGWTGVTSQGGDQVLKVNRNIIKRIDIATWGRISGGMGPIIAYDDANCTAGFEYADNAMSCKQGAPGGYSYKHSGGILFPTVSGNRTFRDADSDLAGVIGPADNQALTIANFG